MSARIFILASALIAMGAGCNGGKSNVETQKSGAIADGSSKSMPRGDAVANKRPDDKKGLIVQPGVAGAAVASEGYLPFDIVKVEQNRKLLDNRPWHSPGGDWTMLSCRTRTPQKAAFLVAVKERTTRGRMLAWGDAALMTDDRQSGERLVAEFSRIFREAGPKSRDAKPVGQLKMKSAVLGQSLRRAAGGGFSGKGGTWTATKWFLQSDHFEAEVFFNFSLATRQGEFSEKDADYRGDLLAQLAIALRDGPLPERTPQNDPTLTAEGPTIGEWMKIGGKDCESFCFHPSREEFVFAERIKGVGSTLFLIPCAKPEQRTFLAKFSGDITGTVPFKLGGRWAVIEVISKDPNSYSSDDPHSVWIVDGDKRSQTVIKGAWNPKHIALPERAVSPDGRFLAVEEWRDRTDGSRGRFRVAHTVSLASGATKMAAIPNISLSIEGWLANAGRPQLALLAGDRWARNPKLTNYRFDPAAGTLKRDDSAKPPSRDVLVSPDGSTSVRVFKRDRMEIKDLKSGTVRTLKFHEYDRNSAYTESLRWVNVKFLVFQGPRLAFIHARTARMNFAMPKPEQRTQVLIGPHFRWAVGRKDDAFWLGTIRKPKSDAGKDR